METYKITCSLWSYTIVVDEIGMIVDCSDRPNGRDHWCLGMDFLSLTKYYSGNGKKINDPTKVKIIQIMQKI